MQHVAQAALADGSAPYDDKVVKQFFTATIVWGVVGMLVGVILALQLAWWPANLGLPYTTFGRLRPLHTNADLPGFFGPPVTLESSPPPGCPS